MVLTVENFIKLYRTLKKGDCEEALEKQLEKYDISQEQFLNYVSFIDDLDLNEDGIRIMFQEVRNGHLKL
jgi:hypothetical protein